MVVNSNQPEINCPFPAVQGIELVLLMCQKFRSPRGDVVEQVLRSPVSFRVYIISNTIEKRETVSDLNIQADIQFKHICVVCPCRFMNVRKFKECIAISNFSKVH